jgi:putative transposase
MSGYRLLPSPAQEAVLRAHCAHARYTWNLAVEQGNCREPGPERRCQGRSEPRDPAVRLGLLVRRLADKAPGRVEKVSPAFTSQRCSACGHVDANSRESQARFACTACGFAGHADVNAARNIAAGHAVTAREGDGVARPVNREPQLLL